MREGVASQYALELKRLTDNGQSCVGGLIHEGDRLINFWVPGENPVTRASSLFSNDFVVGDTLKCDAIVNSENGRDMKSPYEMIQLFCLNDLWAKIARKCNINKTRVHLFMR